MCVRRSSGFFRPRAKGLGLLREEESPFAARSIRSLDFPPEKRRKRDSIPKRCRSIKKTDYVHPRFAGKVSIYRKRDIKFKSGRGSQPC